MPSLTIRSLPSTCLMLLLLAYAGLAPAEPLPDQVRLLGLSQSLPITWSSLGFDSSQHSRLVVSRPPLHGALLETGHQSLTYVPGDDVWTLGTDSFTYDLIPVASRESRQTGLVSLIAPRHAGTPEMAAGFEGPSPLADAVVHDPLGRLSVQPGSAITGAFGVLIDELPAGGVSFLSYEISYNGGNQGSQVVMGVEPPGGNGREPAAPGRNSGPSTDDQLAEAIILAAFNDSDAPLFQVRLRVLSGAYALRAEIPSVGGALLHTPWQPIDLFSQEIVVDWWPHQPSLPSSASLLFWVDDHFAGRLDWPLSEGPGPDLHYKFGIVESFGPAPMGFSFDDLRVETGFAIPSHSIVSTDTFEGTALEGWDLTHAADVARTTPSALSGVHGLQRSFGAGHDADSMVVDPALADAGQHGFRFQVDPNSLVMNDGEAVIFAGISGESHVPGGADQVVRLRLGEGALEGYLLRLEAADASGWAVSNWFAVPDQPHAVELQWRAASGASTGGGYARLWLDGALATQLEGLHNEYLTLGGAWLGGSETDSSELQGELFFDNYEAWSLAR